MTLPYSFAEFTEDQFPFNVTLYRGDQPVWDVEVSGPGALEIPALGEITRCVIRLADGTTFDGGPP
jgi:hypothetical protein